MSSSLVLVPGIGAWPCPARSESAQIAKRKYDATADADRQVIERVAQVTDRLGVSHAHIALAWLWQKQPVTAPIVGATKMSHLDAAVDALSVTLTPDEIASLEEAYVPHPVVGPEMWQPQHA